MRATPEALLDRFLADGDVRAMEELVAGTRAKLTAAVRGIGAPQDADDTVQNAYHSLLRRVAKGPLDAPVLPWLLTTAVRIAYRRKALGRRETALADRLAVERDTADPAAAAATRERDDLLRREVARLPAHYRDAILLHHFEGLAVAEVAALLDVPVATVKARLQRGRRLLGSRLSPSLLYAFFFLPWWCADSVRATTIGLGVTMKAKTAAALVLLVALALTAVVGVWGRGGGGSGAFDRTLPPAPLSSAHEEATADATAGGLAGTRMAELPLPAPVDLGAVDLDHDLFGTVVDRAGAPVASAELLVVSYPWRRSSLLNLKDYDAVIDGPATRSARDGTFRLRLPRGALVNLRVRADGFAPVELNELQAGERVRVRLDRGVSLLVTARDEAGTPVPHVRLRLFPQAGKSELMFELPGETDETGTYRYADLPGGVAAWLEPEHDTLGHPGWGWSEVRLPVEGEAAIELTMPRGRTLRGRVTDEATGEPIEGARVGLGWTYNKPTTTGPDGRYAVAGYVASGTYEVVAAASGYGEVTRPIGAASEIDFALKRGGTVAGRAVDRQGRGVAGALVAAIGSKDIDGVQNTSTAFGTTDAGGAFHLDSLRLDIVHALTLIAPGYGRTLTEFQPVASTDLGDIVMADGRAIEGRVVDASGDPATRAGVVLKGANDDRYRLLPDADKSEYQDNWYGNTEERRTDHLGRFRFPDLAPGTYRLTARLPGRPDTTREVRLGARDVLDVEIRLGDTRELTVKVQDEDGRPIREVIVSAVHAKGQSSARTDADGRATLYVEGRIVTLSTWVLPVQGEERDFLDEKPLADLPETQAEASFVLRRASRIAGRVVGPDGKPVGGAILDIRQGGEPVSQCFADDNGAFSVKVPPVGRFDLFLVGLQREHERGTYLVDTDTEYSGELRGVTAGATDVEFRARREAFDRTLRVRLEAPGGVPVPGATVWLSPAPLTSRANRETDETGTAELSGLPPRMLKLGCRLPPGTDLLMPAEQEITPAGQGIVLLLARGVPLEGVATMPDGTPAEGAAATATVLGSPVSTAVADGRGHFVLHVPSEPRGPVAVTCARPDNDASTCVATAVDVRAGGEPIRLHLTRVPVKAAPAAVRAGGD